MLKLNTLKPRRAPPASVNVSDAVPVQVSDQPQVRETRGSYSALAVPAVPDSRGGRLLFIAVFRSGGLRTFMPAIMRLSISLTSRTSFLQM